jgi:RHO1 GDP-GTP exchange protein 1/2
MPLGIARCGEGELIVIYDTFGCYVDKHGVPSRKAQYVRWEIRALSWAARLPNILLFSADFIEVRDAPTGRLVQVIEAKDIRLLQSACPDHGPLLVGVKGDADDKNGLTDKLVEILETKPIDGSPDEVFLDSQWAEWED